MKTKMILTIASMLFLTTFNSFASTDTVQTDTVLIVQQNDPNDTISNEAPSIVYDEAAQFEGGEAAFTAYLNNHLEYPSVAKEQGIEGRVILSTVIDENGNLTNIQIHQGIGGGCEDEVSRVFNQMPAWKPARRSGNSVKTMQCFSIRFKL
jgi:protein TonB